MKYLKPGQKTSVVFLGLGLFGDTSSLMSANYLLIVQGLSVSSLVGYSEEV